MRTRHGRLLAAALLLTLVAGTPPAGAGLPDTPLPTFSDGEAAQLAALLPGVTKDNNLETVVVCTNLASAPLDVGLEVFDETGTLRNSVTAGDGALLSVASGATVTFGTGAVAALQEDQTLTLNTAGSGMDNLRNGSGRVVASGAPLGCVAFAVDRLHTIQDPAVCPMLKKQLCRQGASTCDFDIEPRQCTFRVRVCLNNRDVNLGNCQPGQVTTYVLRSPAGRSANARTLLDAVSALAPSSRSRRRVSFDPPDAKPDHYTAAVPVRVPLGRALMVKVRAASPTGSADKDMLRLKCVRQPGAH